MRHLQVLWLIVLLGGCAAEGQLESIDNRIPVANAGPDMTVKQGDVVQLSGVRSVDLDDDELTYRWSLTSPTGSSATLVNTNGETTQFTADAVGEYKVLLVVSDGLADSPVDTLIVTATPRDEEFNTAPVANAGDDVNVQLGSTVQLDGTGSSDADGDPLSFAWSMDSRPSGSQAVLSSDAAPRPAFVADEAGEYRISLTVNDGLTTSAADVVIVSAFSNNTPPVANAGPDQTVALGSRVQLDGSTSFDPDGASLTYSWTKIAVPNGSDATLSDTTTPKPSFDVDVEGTYIFELVVSDGELQSAADQVTVTGLKNNLPPVASAGTNQTVSVGQLVTLDGSQSFDPNEDSITYKWSWVSKPATTASFSSATAESPTFTPDIEGEYIAQLIVNDGFEDSAPDSVTITATLANVPPVANAGADQALITGTLVMLDGTGSSDADLNPLNYTWSFTAKPPGSTASLSSTTASKPTFTPDLDGTYVVQLIVNDGFEDSAPDSVVITASTPTIPAPSSEGDVVITEIMPNPDVISDSEGEWFEIYNPTATLWDLKNCVIKDNGTDNQVISSSVIVGPGEYRTLASGPNPGFTPDYVYSSYALANGDDEVILTCNGNEIAQVVYDSANYPYAAAKSMQLSNNKYDEVMNDSAANWCQGTMIYAAQGSNKGTPGAANSVCP